MTAFARPGIYRRPVQPTRRVGGLARRDIAVLIGFATRGPAMVPVRVESLAQFEGVFGGPIATGYLSDAIKGFFESGGRAAYVVRLVGSGAVAASVSVPSVVGPDLVASARTRAASLMAVTAGAQTAPWQDQLLRDFGKSIPDVGVWGNGLSLRVTTRSVVDDARFDIEILEGGVRVEAFDDLTADPNDPRNVSAIMDGLSQYVDLAMGEGAERPQDGLYALTGGTAALDGVGQNDWIAALEAQAWIDDIALIAMPDLVRPDPVAPPATDETNPAPLACHLPTARPFGNIAVRVIDAQTGAPIEGCEVAAAGEGLVVHSDAFGQVVLEGVNLGLVELRVRTAGYEDFTLQVQATRAQGIGTFSDVDADVTELRLMPLAVIPALDVIDIAAVQARSVAGDVVGPFRTSVLDPPTGDLPPEGLLAWTQSLPRSARAFAVGPWVGISALDDGRISLQPPSGHICGVIAATETLKGVHASPGHGVLRYVKTAPMEIAPPLARQFHDASLNHIAALAGQGIRLMGSRTLASATDWHHLSVRRLFDAIERTLLTRMQWAVFEPSNATTRAILAFSIEQFLESLRKRGMFAGTDAKASFQVTCDDTTNTAAGVARGELVTEVAIAPTQPYEFIAFTIASQADAIDVTERT